MVAASAEVLKAINSPRTTRIERIRLLRWLNVYEVNRLSRGELGSRTSRRSVTDQVCCTDRFPNLQRFTVTHVVGTSDMRDTVVPLPAGMVSIHPWPKATSSASSLTVA